MGLSLGHLVIVLLVILVLFGAGKLPQVMADLGRGVRNFKAGLDGKDEAETPPERLTDARQDKSDKI
jgi:sec-independent protein translocase protein TatA